MKNKNQNSEDEVVLTFESFGDVPFLKISNHNLMRPFFMSVVSDSDHWMFISSNGGLTAGRKNAEYALFPYYTDDKITEFADITGSKTIFQIGKDENKVIWEPFSVRNTSSLRTANNLYKSIYGNIIIFEETLIDFGLTFRYAWSSSDTFGFVKTSTLENKHEHNLDIVVLDGIQNLMPYGVSSDLQRASSHLVDAYKRCELHTASGLGIFALSAIIVDKAEPSEALKANIVWSIGLNDVSYLMSSLQLNAFRSGLEIENETDIKGEKGAYFISKKIILQSQTSMEWKIVADVNKNHSQIAKIIAELQSKIDFNTLIQLDIQKGTKNLIQLVTSSDGIQYTNDALQDCRNYSNVLFNIMRGGIFDNGYIVEKTDYIKYLQKANYLLSSRQVAFFESMAPRMDYHTLCTNSQATEDADLIRLTFEYLPLKFSRRHGDPSRPWNRFSINLRDENTGEKILDYEGNWRDIFQNWEALAYSFPEYIDGMIFKFLNASTFDGYNPYRVTKDGFDWEVIEPEDPWSYIGYWGDHQIIYLQKFLEIIEKFKPGRLETYFDQDVFVYAAVPYIIKPYEDIVQNPKDTIDFDHEWDTTIRKNMTTLGADGALLKNNDGEVYRVNLIEKLLTTLLAKMSNFIPEGGIWLNTQRPEWNDANNALVGNGVSMVTLHYIRRFLVFLQNTLTNTSIETVKLSNELIEFYHSIRESFEANKELLTANISDKDRKLILDQLGKAASDYRSQIYKSGFWGKKRTASMAGLKRFIQVSLDFVHHTIQCNQREDGLFHAYNLMTYTDSGVTISYLDEMLEGQVAALSSAYLDGSQSLKVLDAMKKSALFRQDQYSYILYPNKDLLGFLNKNNIPLEEANASLLFQQMISDSNTSIVEKDVFGAYHFNGNFKNAQDLTKVLSQLKDSKYATLIAEESTKMVEIFEKVFNHKSFTGRSGTFFGYEGLGSIYWHMVSKLLLAVQETCLRAIKNQETSEIIGRLLEHYYEIQAGIGVHKSPKLFGAFPTDPYSHTPKHKGAQQPGMTGQVKEDLLCRLGELGIEIEEGQIKFIPHLLKKSTFLNEPKAIYFTDLMGHEQKVEIKVGQLFFTYCQVPICYEINDLDFIEIMYFNGEMVRRPSNSMTEKESSSIFDRKGEIVSLRIGIRKDILK